MTTEQLKKKIAELDTPNEAPLLRAALRYYCRFHLKPNDLKEVPELAAFL